MARPRDVSSPSEISSPVQTVFSCSGRLSRKESMFYICDDVMATVVGPRLHDASWRPHPIPRVGCVPYMVRQSQGCRYTWRACNNATAVSAGFALTLSVLPYKVQQPLQINQLETLKLSNMLIECTFVSFKIICDGRQNDFRTVELTDWTTNRLTD